MHKLLRGMLAVAQLTAALSGTLLGIAQPTLPDALALLQPLVGSPQAALAATTANSVTGMVFRDFDSDGVKDTNEVYGLAGVTVTAYNSAGSSVATTTSNASGMYTLTMGALANNTAVRIEFTALPSLYQPSFVGSNNGSSVQFVTYLTTGLSNIDFAVNVPGDYCQNNPTLAISCFYNGTGSTNPAMYKFPYSASGTSGYSTAATSGQIGSTWGVAYHRTSKKLLTSAMLRRHTGLGPSGIGAIYSMDPTFAAAANGTLFVDVASIGVNVGQASILSNAARGLPTGLTTSSQDPSTFAQIGKYGIGDIDLSEDGTVMYFTNLFDRNVYSMTIGNTPTAPASAANIGGPWTTFACTSGVGRPWGLKVFRDKLYAGAVCTGENGTDTNANLRALVYEYTPGTGWNTTPVINIPLNYTKGEARVGSRYDPTDKAWHIWDDTYTDAEFNASSSWAPFASRATPILTDIEIDSDGAMILGFSDRAGIQLGYYNQKPINTSTIAVQMSGDLLRACSNGVGGWTMESGGACGGVTAGGANGQGPSGGEFYSGDELATYHQETVQGGLVQLMGQPEIAMGMMDPLGINSGGVSWLSHSTGAKNRGLELYSGANDGTLGAAPTNTTKGGYGKAVGLGDMEVLCDLAPIQIGNRVWKDTDGDGVQDAGEDGFSGITVNLLNSGGTVISTTTTDANGVYAFANLAQNTAYTVRVVNTQTPLANWTASPTNAGGITSNAAMTDTRDSDYTLTGVNADIAYTTGGAGSNNHSLDFGFVPPVVKGFVNKTSSANGSAVSPGQRITYTVVITSNSTTTQTNVVISDSIPPGTTYVAGSAVITGYQSGTITGYYSDTFNSNTYSGSTGVTDWSSTPWTEISDNNNSATGNVSLVASNCTNGSCLNIDHSPSGSGLERVVDLSGSTAATITFDYRFVQGFPAGFFGNISFILFDGATAVALATYGNGNNGSKSVAIPAAFLKAGVRIRFVSNSGGAFSGESSHIDNVGINSTGVLLSAQAGGTPPAFLTSPNSFVLNSTHPMTMTYAVTVSNPIPVGVVEIENVVAVSSAQAVTATDTTIDPITGNRLGDYIWLDTDKNGRQDSTDTPLSGITVWLVNPTTGAILSTTTTNAAGLYQFAGASVAAGTAYSIVVPITQTNLLSYKPTIIQGSSATSVEDDSNGVLLNPNQVSTAVVPLNPGEANMTYDFGFVPRTFDWGDLPDGNASGSPSYNTDSTGTAGPRHEIVDGLRIGDNVDGENNGQPSPTATGDDTNVGATLADDEDGVVIPTFYPGNTASVVANVTNLTGSSARFYGFIDFNGDGDFNDANETQSVLVPTGTSGAISLTFTTPANATTAQNIGARFRLSTDQTLGADGPVTTALAPNGEVEDYLIRVIPAIDWGDLDETRGYHTLSSTNGASHIIDPNVPLTLGRLIDAETNGRSSTAADADNLDIIGADDEDSVQLPTFQPGVTAPVTVSVNNPNNLPVTVYFFFDFNGDGDFNDAGEAQTQTTSTSGNVIFNVTPPITTLPDTLLGIRVRVATTASGPLTADGQALNGEVEDYVTTLDAPVQFGDRVWLESDTDGIASTGVIVPIAGMVLTATNGTNTYTTTTDGQGYYSFTVAAGTYTVTYGSVPSTYGVAVPSATPFSNTAFSSAGSYQQTGNPDQSRPQSSVITLTTGQNNFTMDYAFNLLTATFGNSVWMESDNDGIASTGTITPIVGKVITATSSNGMVFTQTTNAQGLYTFTVPAGFTYTVDYGPAPAGTVPSVTPNPATVSAASPGTDQQSRPNKTQVFLTVGDAIQTIDFGFYQLPPNPPVTGAITVTKQVSGSLSNPNTPFTFTVTGPNGYISTTTVINGASAVFTNLVQGVYTVTEAALGAGWVVTYSASSTGFVTQTVTINQAVLTLMGVITAAAVTPGQITGRVFNDYNSDGQITANGTVTDTGVQSVTVTAYDRNGAVAGTATTDASGNYTLTTSTAGPWRLEFTNLPSGYEPSRTGTQNGTSTQFVNSAPATNVNFGVLEPCDYCQNNPNVAVAMQKAVSGVGSKSTMALMPYSLASNGLISPSTTGTFTATLNANMGGIWGMAYNRSQRQIYSSAILRRFAPLGPAGLGGIYITDPNGALPNSATFMTISNVGADPRGGAAPEPNFDNVVTPTVAKVGLGDIDLSADDKTLYVMNLNTRSLVQVDVASKTETASYSVGNPGCANANDVRPWAVKAYRDEVYVGVTCSGQTNATLNGQNAYVLKLVGSSFTTVASMPLTYTRDAVFAGGGACASVTQWQPWETGPNTCQEFSGGAGGFDLTRQVGPFPLLSDIEFDVDGSLILGFADRASFVMQSTIGGPGYAGGDTLRLCKVGGSFVREGQTGCAFNDANEFYRGDGVADTLGGNFQTHPEDTIGGLALLPGSGELVTSAYDPVDGDWDGAPLYNTGGLAWLNNTTGAKHKGAYSYTANDAGNFGKSGGIGDVELLCDSAPIEIGNRVWQDVNNNGVQDPGEPAIAGVTVQLLNPTTGAVVSTTTTNANGEYYFRGESSGTYTQTLRPNMAYSISIATGQTALSGLTLTTKDAQALSGTTVTSNNAISDTRDSDATLLGANAVIYYTTGGAGSNNHGLDFGFSPAPTGTVVITNTPPVALGNRLWLDVNNNGIADAGEVNAPDNTVVELYQDTNGDGVFSAGDARIGNTVTTGGYYTFTGLLPTTSPNTAYIVVISSTNFIAGGTLQNYRSSSGIANNDTSAANNDRDHGSEIGTLGSGGVVASRPITLTSGTQPTGEGNEGNEPTQTSNDANSNQTIDFGFYKLEVGNLVWTDINDNGIYEPGNGETPLANVPVAIMSGTQVVYTTTTGPTGLYTFTNLISGTYVISMTPPVGYRSSSGQTATDGGDGTDHGAPSGAFITSQPFDLTPGGEPNVITSTGTTQNPNLDFGLYAPLANLGNQVWFDANDNGQLDSGEAGVDNVRVELYTDTNNDGIYTPGVDTFVRFSTTVAGGYYTFTALPEGNYVVVITSTNFAPGGALQNYRSSDPNESNPNLNGDNNDNGLVNGVLGNAGYVASNAISLTVGSEPNATIAAGDSNWTVDFGFYKLEVGNLVWDDINNDGLFNNAEVPFPGITVTLLDNSGNVVSTTTTNASGLYTFTSLLSGTYVISVTPPAGYVSSAGQDTGKTVDNNDNGAPSGAFIVSPPTQFVPGAEPNVITSTGTTQNPTMDFGLHKPLVNLGNQVWYDTNNNGVLDAGEQGVQSVRVELYQDSNGDGSYTPGVDQFVGFQTTQPGGYYTFTNLTPTTNTNSNYLVVITNTNFVAGGALYGYRNSDGNGAIAPDPDDNTNDDDNGTPVGVLGSGGYVASLPINLTDGGEPSTTVSAGDSNWTVDFGFYNLSLGNTVWNDANNNGLLDVGEQGVSGVTVTLYSNGNVISTTTTNASGLYNFTNLVSGTYTMSAQTPAGYQSSNDIGSTGTPVSADGDDNGVGSGTQLITTQPFNLQPGLNIAGVQTATNATGATVNPSVDFGIWQPLNLGNQVWYDANDNGQLDGSEAGVSGVAVELYRDTNGDGIYTPGSDSLVSTTTTSAGGFYTFSNLLQGGYLVVITGTNFVGAGVLAGYRSSDGAVLGNSDSNNRDHGNENAGATNGSAINYVASTVVTLTAGTEPDQTTVAGDSNFSIDFGFYKMELGNLIWEDVNNNGILDSGELPIANVAVELRDATSDALISTTTSNGSGYYTFTNLISGTYRVVLPASNFQGVGVLVGLTSSTGANGQATGAYEPGIGESNSLADENSDHGSVFGGVLGSGTGIVRSGVITLTPGTEPISTQVTAFDQQPTIDFGLFRPAKLGDYVWYDLNHDGVQNNSPGETGVGGVTVTLFSNGGIVSTTLTDSTGGYSFTNLISGTYSVTFGLPGSLTFTVPSGNPADTGATDSDAQLTSNPQLGVTGNIDLSYGETEPDIDAGVWLPASLGDYVWIDLNGDGLQNNSEQGVPGVTATLFIFSPTLNSFVQLSQTTTNNNGYYEFPQLISATYQVVFSTPPGYTWTVPTAGNVISDSNVITPATGATAPVVLNAGEQNPTIDGGLTPYAALGDYVWEDINHDGFQTTSEPGVNGVAVSLYRNGVIVSTTTTFTGGPGNAPGYYTFTSLISGTYSVTFGLPAGYTFTKVTPNSTDTTLTNAGGVLDNNVTNQSLGSTNNIVLNWGEQNPTIDAGIWRPASLGDYVWEDLNHDGDQDGTEPGVNGVAVTLLDPNGNVVSTTTTFTGGPGNVPGYYTFTDLISGTYVVQFTLPNGYSWTLPNNALDGVDSDASYTGTTGSYTLFPGDSNPTVDAGLWRPAALGDVVWFDINHNGAQDGGAEIGVPGVVVRLLDGSGQPMDNPNVAGFQPFTLTTDNSGTYSFTNLISGTYIVEFDLTTLPTNYQPTIQGVTGSKDITDSDASPTTGRTEVITLVAGESDPSWDLGIWLPASLGDLVWEDYNHNGQQDGGEPGVPGITVTLLNQSGGVVSTTVTNASGLYSFTQLTPGTYSVVFTPTAEYFFTVQTVGVTTTDSNPNPLNGTTAQVTLAPGEYNPTIDAGLWRPMSLGNRVWFDTNDDGLDNDGVANAQGTGVFGVQMDLYVDTNGNGVYDPATDTLTSTTFTDAGGYYTFTGLISQTYFVVMPSTNFTGTGPLVDYRNSDPTETNANNDVDKNDNGIVSGVLGATGGVVASGPIQLRPGTEPTNDGDLTPDSNSNFSIDFGFYKQVLGNLVWNDANNDGLLNNGETGIPSVPVALLDDSGNVISTTTTDASGLYTFTSVPSGTFVVSVTLPADYKSSTGSVGNPTGPYEPGANPSNGVDGDDNGSQTSPQTSGQTVTSAPFAMTPGLTNTSVTANSANGTTVNPTIDFGAFKPFSLGNRVWIDKNNDGAVDVGDGATPGIDGVTVRLYASDGTTLISTTTTSGGGYYRFDNLIEGSYIVEIAASNFNTGAPLEGYRSSSVDEVNPNNDGDNNDNGLGTTPNLTTGVRSGPIVLGTDVAPSEPLSETDVFNGQGAVDSRANMTVDFGFYKPSLNLGNQVWFDTNDNGVIDGSEQGVDGVVVELYRDTDGDGVFSAGDVFVAVSTTVAGGYYTFTDLVEGNYIVVITSTNFVGTGALVNYQSSDPTSTTPNDNTDNDDNGVTNGVLGSAGFVASNAISLTVGSEPATTIAAGDSNWSLDFGFYKLVLGNTVWVDTNNNGLQDTGEIGLPNVPVSLYRGGVVISTTTTDANGNYQFTNLMSGTYTVSVQLPTGYQSSADIGSSGTPISTDQDDNGAGGSSGTVNSAPFDLVPGVNVAGVQTATNSNGTTVNPSVDFGVYLPASLGDYVWEDYDHDGVQDLNEPRVQGVQVVLYDGVTNTPVLTATTSITGYYRFDGLTPSVPYYVVFTAPSGYAFTQQGSNPISALDSNANPVTGQTAPVILVSGEHNPTIDAGLWRPASLGDYVWEDTNANGIQDEVNTGVNGVFVELLDAGGNVVSTTTTYTGGPNNAAGYYTFTNLISNTYQVRFTAPAGYSVTKANVGADGTDSDGILQSGQIALTGPYVLNAGESNPTVDLGLFKPASLGDRVWYDYDVDGIQDSNEITGVVGVQVVLYDAVTNRPVATTTTGADGLYAFTNLVPGSYFVEFTLPAGYGRSPGDVSGVGKDATDSDANPTTGRTVPVTLVSGENDPTWDAGIYQLSSLGDRVWEDKNLNGTQDGGEPGVPGVTVTLYQNGVPISTTTTDASGFYGFSNLTPTLPYSVVFALPSGYTSFTKVDVGAEGTDSDAVPQTGNPVTGTTGPITLLPGENNPNVDAGVIKPAGLGDYVWVDVNRDGQQQTGEPGIPGVVVTLYSNGVPVGTTTTNASGFYSFTNLTPGVPYSVSFGLPGGFAWTLPTVGITTTDSNVDANGSTTPVTLVSGEFNPTIDAGVISTLKIDKVGVGSGINGSIGKDKQITYTLVVSNTGAGAISNVVVDDPLPAGLTYAGKSTPAPASTNPLKWTLGTLNAGEVKTIVFVVNAIVNTGTLTNVAYLNGPLGDKQILMAQDAASTSFAPDVVALMKFEAKREKGGIKIIWQTSQEVNTFGFALYRSESFDSAQDAKRGEAVLATPELIPAQGRTGGTYAYLDATAKANKRYTYWLIEAETTGAMNEYGPTSVGAEATEVALQPNAVAAAGGVPVAGLPIAVAGPVKQLGQRVLVETQPQTVNAVVVQQATTPSQTTDGGRQTTASQTTAQAPAAPVSRQAVMEAMANPPKPQILQVAPQHAVVAEQAAPSAVSDVGASAARAPAQASVAQAQPEARVSIGLLVALLVAGLLALALVGAGVVFLRQRGRRE